MSKKAQADGDTTETPTYEQAVVQVADATKKFCDAGLGSPEASQLAFDLYVLCLGKTPPSPVPAE